VGLVDKVKGGTVVSKWTTLVDIVLPVVQLWVRRKGKIVDPSPRLETQTVVSKIASLQLVDVSQVDYGTLVVHRLVELTLSNSRDAPTMVTYIDDCECLDMKL
jgi:NMD protein affecting ribosome stability and mRNA decay